MGSCEFKDNFNKNLANIAKNVDVNMVKNMELHLHEQYAINSNSNLTAILPLFVGLLAVLGAYGTYFLDSCFEKYIFIAVVSLGVLDIIEYICFSLGFKQRKDQFLVHAIRCKYYANNKLPNDIYPTGYHPFNKVRLDIIQGLYGVFIRIIQFTKYFLVISFFFKFNKQCGFDFSTWDLNKSVSCVFIGLYFVLGYILISKYRGIVREYIALSNFYSELNPDSEKKDSADSLNKSNCIILDVFYLSKGIINCENVIGTILVLFIAFIIWTSAYVKVV